MELLKYLASRDLKQIESDLNEIKFIQRNLNKLEKLWKMTFVSQRIKEVLNISEKIKVSITFNDLIVVLYDISPEIKDKLYSEFYKKELNVLIINDFNLIESWNLI